MTATASIVKSQSRNVLRVPSQALSFTPAGAAKPVSGQRSVWTLRDGKLVQVQVTVGLDDQSFAEIKSGDLNLGDQVVTSEGAATKTDKSKAAATPSLHL
jgi:multidrug efflux pump subunit AcrA (membrane-fusion protein)